ncbi:unnamed protein product [Dicrocoelium dendriticum]|nr:unnamed protein product [Dicrocoelium dendriticum]
MRYQVLSLLSSVVGLLCFLVSIASTAWISKNGTRTGLYEECRLSTSNNPATSNNSSCVMVFTSTRERLACAVLGPTALIIIVIGILLFIGAMLTMDVRKKFIFYNSVIIIYTLASLAILTTIIILPISVDKIKSMEVEIVKDGTQTITMGWAYIMVLCGLGCLLIAIILLVVDRKADEVGYRECVHRP